MAFNASRAIFWRRIAESPSAKRYLNSRTIYMKCMLTHQCASVRPSIAWMENDDGESNVHVENIRLRAKRAITLQGKRSDASFEGQHCIDTESHRLNFSTSNSMHKVISDRFILRRKQQKMHIVGINYAIHRTECKPLKKKCACGKSWQKSATRKGDFLQ